LIKIIIQEENFKWHLEAFASELFICLLACNFHNILLTLQKVFAYGDKFDITIDI